jgi:hypothetical protein
VLRELRYERKSGSRGLGGGGAEGGRTLYLPTSFRNLRKRSFYSAITDPTLPCNVPPMSVNAEVRVISALLTELSLKFGVAINTKPNLEHGGVTPVTIQMPE